MGAPEPAPGVVGEAAKIDAAETAKIEARAVATIQATDAAMPAPEPTPRLEPGPQSNRTDAARIEAIRPAGSTALVLARPQLKAERANPEPAQSAQASPHRGFRSLAATAAIAAAVGGLAGSLATAGIIYLKMPPPSAPVDYTGFTAALGRVNHDLAALKAGIANSTKATNQQVTKIADRMDHTEKAQAEAGSRLAKAGDSIDRVERRLAAAAAPAPVPTAAAAPATDVTGAIAETHVATETSPAADAKRSLATPSPLLVVDGWVLRDVYRGAALIQGRGGVIEVLPGDQLPALGRVEQIKRQDGRWVVVTSRGLIVQR